MRSLCLRECRATCAPLRRHSPFSSALSTPHAHCSPVLPSAPRSPLASAARPCPSCRVADGTRMGAGRAGFSHWGLRVCFSPEPSETPGLACGRGLFKGGASESSHVSRQSLTLAGNCPPPSPGHRRPRGRSFPRFCSLVHVPSSHCTALVGPRTRSRGASRGAERLLRVCVCVRVHVCVHACTCQQRGPGLAERAPAPDGVVSQSPGAVTAGPRRVSDCVSSSLRNWVSSAGEL